ncbi:STAS domain-containing protein [Nocardioides sp. Kera G14]|uniref:STAS domain-containing protein n=1 Tax=Nocardioides sp. Kera G14 TaxID=2884264 RepID=UPI001D120E00|nr:STAS domain-containing protein [Nocardioides sp. Kera G14]UDY23649.1 STAS domain-containing protein [Nocardioides sp. Kera G14]
MATESNTWVRLLVDNREELLQSWAAVVERNLTGRMTVSESAHDIREIFDGLVAGGSDQSAAGVRGESFDSLRALLADLGRTRGRQGFSPTEAVTSIFALKTAVLELLERTGDAEGYRAFAQLSLVMDDLGLYMLETYASARETVIAQQTETLLELSTPVVKLWDGIVALPLVGTLDSARTQVVMEALLQALVETGSEHAIIDITGVAAVDTQVAQHLLKTVQAARLLGAECIVSGIRPQIAQTVVALGIEFGDIHTKASLADAMLLAMRRSGLDVVSRA